MKVYEYDVLADFENRDCRREITNPVRFELDDGTIIEVRPARWDEEETVVIKSVGPRDARLIVLPEFSNGIRVKTAGF